MPLNREQMLAEMGIRPLWELRTATAGADAGQQAVASEESPGLSSPASVPLAVAGTVTGAPLAEVPQELDWDQLEAAIHACRACALCKQRRQAVPGVGDRRANWLFIGEGPGAEEDARGEPFVGQAGRLLDSMLAALDLRRGQDVYIANAVKCRPPGNRTPEAGEMAACRPFLMQQIALIQPRLIVLLGRAAVSSLLGEDRPLSAMRGKRYTLDSAGRQIPVIVTYHPAYLLRNLPDKAKAWEDLLFARRMLNDAV